MRCAIMLRPSEHYKAGVFAEGLKRHGYQIEPKWQRSPAPGDLLLLWNRVRSFEPVAEMYERAGARVLVVENGYTQPTEGGKYYSLAIGHHSGAGRWYVGDQPRHEIPEKPWRERGEHVLVLPQRGIGERGVTMPLAWPSDIVARLKRMTSRPIVVRKHPGHPRLAVGPPLEQDLAGAHCVVTWGSGAGVKSIQAGIPAFHELASWIAAPAAAPLVNGVEDCNICERRLAWTRISWSQWTISEIQSGEAFDGLLNVAHRDLFCAQQ